MDRVQQEAALSSMLTTRLFSSSLTSDPLRLVASQLMWVRPVVQAGFGIDQLVLPGRRENPEQRRLRRTGCFISLNFFLTFCFFLEFK